MKQITILRMRPGAETQAKALELFLTHGTTRETEWVMASANSQTYISLGDINDDPDLTGIATYAPYFDMEAIPVVAVDDTWVAAMQEAVQRQQ